jgi:hypothetical protein
MKTNQTTKNFDAVGYMRQVRDKISNEIADLSKEEILEYFKQRRQKNRIIPSA